MLLERLDLCTAMALSTAVDLCGFGEGGGVRDQGDRWPATAVSPGEG